MRHNPLRCLISPTFLLETLDGKFPRKTSDELTDCQKTEMTLGKINKGLPIIDSVNPQQEKGVQHMQSTDRYGGHEASEILFCFPYDRRSCEAAATKGSNGIHQGL
ncbi:MAG: hypothetical protein KDK25_09840 [Leptospiraceae bacterium]|nr:hypothetical protein [Leptospiraceae bacterium]